MLPHQDNHITCLYGFLLNEVNGKKIILNHGMPIID